MAFADDIDRIMEIMDAAFDPLYREAWNRRQVTDALLMGNYSYHLIDPDGAEAKPGEPAAGFYMARQAADEVELLLLAVTPPMRGRGLGTRLLDHLFNQSKKSGASKIFLEMRIGNPAETLYRKCGFCEIGLRKAYYRWADGRTVDAITLGLQFRHLP